MKPLRAGAPRKTCGGRRVARGGTSVAGRDADLARCTIVGSRSCASPRLAVAVASARHRACGYRPRDRERLYRAETALYDDREDQFIVSNLNGALTAKDDNGFISRLGRTGA